MVQKRAELAALWPAPTPEQAKITAKQKELNALRDQMQQKALDFQMQARKIAPGAAVWPVPGKGGQVGLGLGLVTKFITLRQAEDKPAIPPRHPGLPAFLLKR